MDKYLPLFNYLKSIKNNNISLFFTEIEEIINAELPISAYKYREWWSNGENSRHSQTFSWRDCGWQVDKVDFNNKKVYFEKKFD
ncbi:DUF7662 domain-containing protein [Treponema denticola]|uniref:DUF7662 domain-containing protein n=1 Tax=Treponema denticola OTK TaxID=999434 RepID=A0A0F6MSX0_TREDN|nr:hypothetical protein [Treponema denticola]EMB19964.1 hypothetical protein HMPREF9724_02413 [Treponema denticola SP37]EMB24542.1 hypothetical protein HMPREF9723_00230 [Treponema denticola OTK]EPF32560.1 hypothetical protein HMPREF9734_02649 [Treponema denticola SP44]EPF40048.1 hypothetical protein HMPREF9731_00658 [Treponema denticola SP23]